MCGYYNHGFFLYFHYVQLLISVEGCMTKVSVGDCIINWSEYSIAGNFRGIQFSQKGSMQRFHDVIFLDGHSK